MKKNFFVLISSFFIVFFTVSSVYVKADSASLVVKLGSLASGGLSDSAFLGTFGPIAGVLTAYALQANGINTHISEASAQQGLTKTEYIYQTLSTWSDVTNRDALDVVQSLVNNVTYGSGGTLYFAQDALKIIEQIGNWIVGNSQIYSESLPIVSHDTFLNVGNFNFPAISVGDSYVSTSTSGTSNRYQYFNITSINSSENVFIAQYFNNPPNTSLHQWRLVLISPSAFTVSFRKEGRMSGNSSYTGEQISNSVFYAETDINGGYYVENGQLVNVPSLGSYGSPSAVFDMLKSLGNEYSITTNSPDIPDQFYGDTWSDNVSGLSLPEGYTGAIDTGVIQGLQDQIQGVGDYVIGLQDYIHALEDAINGREADVPIVDTDTSIPFPIPVPQEVTPVYTPVAPESYPAEDEVEEVVNPEIVAPSTDIINGLQFDLTQVFPFCIPFDIYALLQKFVADPVAPQVHIDWDIPFVDSNFVLDIDFSAYNSVAAVLRTMELIGAIVGLAIATRAIYLRS